jgi:hypothetical protein
MNGETRAPTRGRARSLPVFAIRPACDGFGYVLVGAAGNVDINNGNCPRRITGFFGRPLP